MLYSRLPLLERKVVHLSEAVYLTLSLAQKAVQLPQMVQKLPLLV